MEMVLLIIHHPQCFLAWLYRLQLISKVVSSMNVNVGEARY